jgi:hypothetical protein
MEESETKVACFEKALEESELRATVSEAASILRATSLEEKLQQLQAASKARVRTLEVDLGTTKAKLETVQKDSTATHATLTLGARAWNGPFIHNLSSQILLFAAHQQPRKDVPNPTYFQTMIGHERTVRDSKYRELCNIYDVHTNLILR